MNELEIRKIAKEEFISNVMNNLDSTLIFTYIQNLEQKANTLQSKIDKAIEYIENNKIYEWKTYRDENFQLQGEKIESDMISKSAILDILKEDK